MEIRPIPRVEVSARAARDIRRARDWWLLHREKAPEAFDEELGRLAMLLEMDAGRVGKAMRRAPDVRRVLLRRIRYFVFFQVLDGGARVRILAVWHANRGDEPAL